MNTSPTPIADQIDRELDKLLLLGFTASQAKTIIVARTIQAGNESKQITPPAAPPADFDPTPAKPITRIIDQDGDIWVPAGHNNSDGEMLWRCPSEHYMAHRTRNQIASNFGIHKEEFE